MKNKSVNTASFYYSLNMLKLLQDMNLVTEDEVAKIKKSLSEHYGVTDMQTKRRMPDSKVTRTTAAGGG